MTPTHKRPDSIDDGHTDIISAECEFTLLIAITQGVSGLGDKALYAEIRDKREQKTTIVIATSSDKIANDADSSLGSIYTLSGTL